MIKTPRRVVWLGELNDFPTSHFLEFQYFKLCSFCSSLIALNWFALKVQAAFVTT